MHPASWKSKAFNTDNRVIIRIFDDQLLLLQRESSLNAYTTWYPPVQQTLLCLSKLYRCVEARVFAGLAQDAVSSCAAAVQVGKSQELHSMAAKSFTNLPSPYDIGLEGVRL